MSDLQCATIKYVAGRGEFIDSPPPATGVSYKIDGINCHEFINMSGPHWCWQGGHCAVLFWAPVVDFRLYVGNIVILSVASRTRHCCCASCCYSGNAAVAVPFAPAAGMLRTICNTTKLMHTY